MAWNEPGGNKNRDPWNNNDNGPPDLDEVFANLKQRVNKVLGGKGGGGGFDGGGPSNMPIVGGGALFALVLVAAIAWAVFGGLFVIQPAERGVLTRFGAFVGTAEPGLGWNWPWPIGAMDRVNVDQNRSIVLSDEQVLTQDENIVEIDMGVQYVISDAQAYLFNNRSPDVAVREMSESAVREVIGQETMDFILTQGRDEIAARTMDTLQESLNLYGAGLLVTTVNLENAQPPDEVKAAFDDATKAREDEQRYINEADAYRNRVIPLARGDARQMLEDAKAYRTRVVQAAEGESARFLSLLGEYQKAPEVTRERLYLDTMSTVYGGSAKVMMGSDNDNVLYLPLQGGAGAGAPTPGLGGPALPATVTDFFDQSVPSSSSNSSSARSRSRSR